MSTSSSVNMSKRSSANTSRSAAKFLGYECSFVQSINYGPIICNACKKKISSGGALYHCKSKGWNLHPTRCLELKERYTKKERTFILREDTHIDVVFGKPCYRCKKKDRENDDLPGFSYVTSDGYRFHVPCYMELEELDQKLKKKKGGSSTTETILEGVKNVTDSVRDSITGGFGFST